MSQGVGAVGVGMQRGGLAESEDRPWGRPGRGMGLRRTSRRPLWEKGRESPHAAQVVYTPHSQGQDKTRGGLGFCSRLVSLGSQGH